MGRPLQFRNAADWRRWLKSHHATDTEALVFVSKKATPGGIHYEEALEEALCFGWIDGRLRSHDTRRFVLRFSPRKADSVWSESNRKRALRLIRAARMTPPGLAKIRAATASGAWQAARRPSAKPKMPVDLAKALRSNAEAWSNFRAFADSYQAGYIFWVTDAKKEETRERRICRVVERAAQNKRPGIDGP